MSISGTLVQSLYLKSLDVDAKVEVQDAATSPQAVTASPVLEPTHLLASNIDEDMVDAQQQDDKVVKSSEEDTGSGLQPTIAAYLSDGIGNTSASTSAGIASDRTKVRSLARKPIHLFSLFAILGEHQTRSTKTRRYKTEPCHRSSKSGQARQKALKT